MDKKMIALEIDSVKIEAEEGATILSAAKSA
jgi:NADH dehydrogenase/NADH:ubiquinone oxidoreductase subunit G